MRRLAGVLLVLLCGLAAAHALESVPKPEYRERRVKLADQLSGGVAVLLSAPEPTLDFMPYRQDSDFYYLTGWTEPGAALVVIGAGPATVVPRSGENVPAHPYREILFLPSRNLVMEKYTGIKMDAATPGAAREAGVDAVMPFTSLPEALGRFVAEDRRRAQTVWTQEDSQTAAASIALLAGSLGLSPDAIHARDIRALTRVLRTYKSPAEIELLRKAAMASSVAQMAGMRAIRPGIRERTVAGIEIATMMAYGCERVSYAPIVGSGQNSTTLHYSSNDAEMKAGDVVVIDAAGEYSMYAADITRTMPVSGHFTPRQREIYEIVLGAQRAAASAFVAGRFMLGNVNARGPEISDTLDKVAFDYINSHGKDLHGEPLGKYFLHGLGHSVGIDVHDPMDPKTKLDKGVVFTIEPGIYIPEERIGVRIEDTVYVDASGRLVDLESPLAHEPSEVESAMLH